MQVDASVYEAVEGIGADKRRYIFDCLDSLHSRLADAGIYGCRILLLRPRVITPTCPNCGFLIEVADEKHFSLAVNACKERGFKMRDEAALYAHRNPEPVVPML